MTTKPFILAGFAMLFILASCSSDDASAPVTIANNDNAVFDYYTIEMNSVSANPASTFRKFTTATLLDGKFFSETSEQFIDGVSQGQSANQHYFYENDLLVKRAYDDDVRNFFYDGQNRLIAINWQYGPATNLYYRFVYNGNTVFFEKLSLAYDNPAAQIVGRIILDFDDNDNVIKAGIDNDLDGISNSFHTFEYNANNNLTVAHNSDGSVVNFAYAPIKDNFAKLAYNTYGRKNLMVYQGECFANFFTNDMRQSPNLRDTDTQEALIETQGFPYYFRKTQTMTTDNGNTTTVTTFYFE